MIVCDEDGVLWVNEVSLVPCSGMQTVLTHCNAIDLQAVSECIVPVECLLDCAHSSADC